MIPAVHEFSATDRNRPNKAPEATLNRTVPILIVMLGVTIHAVGCRTGAPASRTAATTELAARVAALSNEVTSLSSRVAAMERDVAETKAAIEFLQRLVDDKMYEPVVEERLIGVPDSDRK